MAGVNLVKHVTELGKRAEKAGVSSGDAMADSLRQATARYLGGLSMSGTGQSVTITSEGSRPGHAAVSVGGAYGLADKGRRRAVGAVGAGGPLRTPWGPRRSVKGSTWGGFQITARHGDEAIQAGIKAALAEIERGG